MKSLSKLVETQLKDRIENGYCLNPSELEFVDNHSGRHWIFVIGFAFGSLLMWGLNLIAHAK